MLQFKVRLKEDPYLIINIIITGVILAVFAYSGAFSPESNNYPVPCFHEKLTGEHCISCGLSHSFSLIMRGRLEEAYAWNVYGMRVFFFFASQLFLRIFFISYYLNFQESHKPLITLDITGSLVIFIISFYPFFKQLFFALF
jgi:hypothetical protein